MKMKLMNLRHEPADMGGDLSGNLSGLWHVVIPEKLESLFPLVTSQTMFLVFNILSPYLDSCKAT